MKDHFHEFASYDGYSVVLVRSNELVAVVDPAADRRPGREMPELGKTVPSGYCRLILRNRPDLVVKAYVSDVAKILEEE